MISEKLKAIIDKLKEQGKMIFLEGATEDQITQFEKDHEIELPEKYKEWLQYSDGVLEMGCRLRERNGVRELYPKQDRDTFTLICQD